MKEPFKCDICDERFANKFNLKKHIKSMRVNQRETNEKIKYINAQVVQQALQRLNEIYKETYLNRDKKSPTS